MPRMAPELSDEAEGLLPGLGEAGTGSVPPGFSPPMAASATKRKQTHSPSDSLQRRALRFCMLQAVRVWAHLPVRARCTRAGESLGHLIHFLVRKVFERQQYVATYFLRNRPELELIIRLLSPRPRGSRIKVTVLACSKGAEVYSIAWAVRSARPDIDLHIQAIDIVPEMVSFAEQAIYSYSGSGNDGCETRGTSSSGDPVARDTERDQGTSIFERVTAAEFDEIFELAGDQVSIRPWLRQNICWSCGDAGDPELGRRIGPQDIVVANRFLCHMAPPQAERCLRNIGKLVEPGGYLLVTGIDLDVRQKVARSLGWTPVLDLIREIHDGDSSLREGWPLNYWALEPFSRRRRNWQFRYASVFRIGEQA